MQEALGHEPDPVGVATRRSRAGCPSPEAGPQPGTSAGRRSTGTTTLSPMAAGMLLRRNTVTSTLSPMAAGMLLRRS